MKIGLRDQKSQLDYHVWLESKLLNIMGVVKEFLESSTIHGVSYIQSAQVSDLGRKKEKC